MNGLSLRVVVTLLVAVALGGVAPGHRLLPCAGEAAAAAAPHGDHGCAHQDADEPGEHPADHHREDRGGHRHDDSRCAVCLFTASLLAASAVRDRLPNPDRMTVAAAPVPAAPTLPVPFPPYLGRGPPAA